ncbi:hypothetical protein BS47DRAFT_1349146 [Hydnum rufescens UP504]|uniref:DUF1742-domain-containing protein n=1 Tax=Hydnum rufescens UP504 TaxID=1448309 RepID=A0A9P6ARC8_9AGAM|nr:hypothetical protein BS47DRAFT_1349146 [Hydnum rufescens UP504]
MSNTDFLYTCETHLSDPGFATSLPPSNPAPPKLSDPEIAKIKEEWEEKQRLNKAKEADKSKDEDTTDKCKGKDSPKESSATKSPNPSVPLAPIPAVPVASSHARFALHREIFAMRQMEHRKRRQVARVKQVAPMLPSVPRT